MAKTSKNILDEARAQIKSIDIDEARRMLEKPGTVLLDVREGDEWRQGHITQAVGIPRGFLELRVEEKVPDHKTPVILQCASGTRSLLAARSLREMGYENLYNLTGGFNAWKDRGLPWTADRQFTADELTRYSRHFVIPEVGEKGQAKLLDAKVLLLGAGALGSSSAFYLAAAGVGTLGIIDADVVEESNLQRQIIHNTKRIGQYKAESARESIEALNPDVKVITYIDLLDESNVARIIDDYDVIIDGTDNFPTRYLLNDAALRANKPVVHGSVFRFEGQLTVFKPYEGPCYRCLYPEPPPPELAPSCAEAGVLGVLPGIIGLLQATETIKLLLGIGDPLVGRLMTYDGLAGEFSELRLFRDPNCPACGEHAHLGDLPIYADVCAMPVRA